MASPDCDVKQSTGIKAVGSGRLSLTASNLNIEESV
tara:strand:+ start:799 stop:906 length:108 start_codon:yes stop_codon:yes gene_type:complete